MMSAHAKHELARSLGERVLIPDRSGAMVERWGIVRMEQMVEDDSLPATNYRRLAHVRLPNTPEVQAGVVWPPKQVALLEHGLPARPVQWVDRGAGAGWIVLTVDATPETVQQELAP